MQGLRAPARRAAASAAWLFYPSGLGTHIEGDALEDFLDEYDFTEFNAYMANMNNCVCVNLPLVETTGSLTFTPYDDCVSVEAGLNQMYYEKKMRLGDGDDVFVQTNSDYGIEVPVYGEGVAPCGSYGFRASMRGGPVIWQPRRW